MGDADGPDPLTDALRALGDEAPPPPSDRFADRLESHLRATHAATGPKAHPLRRLLVRPVAVLGLAVLVVLGVALATLGGDPETGVDVTATPPPPTTTEAVVPSPTAVPTSTPPAEATPESTPASTPESTPTPAATSTATPPPVEAPAATPGDAGIGPARPSPDVDDSTPAPTSRPIATPSPTESPTATPTPPPTPTPTESPTPTATPVPVGSVTLTIAQTAARFVQLSWSADDASTVARWRVVALRNGGVELIAAMRADRTSVRVPRPLQAPVTVVIQALAADGTVLVRSNAVVVPTRER